jgi:hypothetical protein
MNPITSLSPRFSAHSQLFLSPRAKDPIFEVSNTANQKHRRQFALETSNFLVSYLAKALQADDTSLIVGNNNNNLQNKDAIPLTYDRYTLSKGGENLATILANRRGLDILVRDDIPHASSLPAFNLSFIETLRQQNGLSTPFSFTPEDSSVWSEMLPVDVYQKRVIAKAEAYSEMEQN